MQIACCVMDEMVETFESIDANGDKSICFEEFAALMREIDAARTDADLRRNFDLIDSDRDGRVSFHEFQAWMLS